MKIRILIGFTTLILVLLILTSGCMEISAPIEPSTPVEEPIQIPTKIVCGNHVVEEGETSENCCIDVGCPEGKSCESNVCVELEKYQDNLTPKEDVGTNKGTGDTNVEFPNPATLYCMRLYPNQTDTFGTCHYAGRANDEYNSIICEGDCGYSCVCTPDCGHPTSENCQQATEVKCICGGDTCERPCFFPDGTNCPMWDFYRGKCGQNWSYCKQQGYELKNISQDEGWFRGGVCIDENGTDIGNVYDLMELGGERENKSEEIIIGGTGIGVPNPAAILCTELGYKYKTTELSEEGQIGYCIFPDNTNCSAWEFYAGKCGQKWSFCKKQGYDIKTEIKGKDPYSAEYTICVDNYVRIGSVTDLINLRDKVERIGCYER